MSELNLKSDYSNRTKKISKSKGNNETQGNDEVKIITSKIKLKLLINSSLKFEIMAKQLYVASQRVL